MTWLVTGGSGFLGRHVLDALRDGPGRVVALGRRHPGGWPVEDFVRADLDDREGLRRAVAAVAPDVVIHAAGKTPPASAHAMYLANTRNTAHLLDALRALDQPTRVILAGSAAELGPVPVEHLPVAEDYPCRPRDPYGMSKWAASRLGLDAERPLEVVVARIFNMIGPGMPTSQAFGRFAAALADPATLTLMAGDLSPRRDFVDVRDAASALVTLAGRGTPGTAYHVGTGQSRSIRDGLDLLIRLSGRPILVEESPLPAWRRGPANSRADVSRLVGEAGWLPRIAWETSLADLWDEAARRARTKRVA